MADFVAVGVGFGVAVGRGVGVGVGAGVGVAATASGDGRDAGELATSAPATALSAELRGLVIAESELAALVVGAGEPTEDVAPAEDGWLLVHAASAAAQRTVTIQRAGVGLVVRSRLAMDPG